MASTRAARLHSEFSRFYKETHLPGKTGVTECKCQRDGVSGPFGSCLHSLCVSFFSLGVILMPMLSLLKENLGMSSVTHMAAHTSHNLMCAMAVYCF